MYYDLIFEMLDISPISEPDIGLSTTDFLLNISLLLAAVIIEERGRGVQSNISAS